MHHLSPKRSMKPAKPRSSHPSPRFDLATLNVCLSALPMHLACRVLPAHHVKLSDYDHASAAGGGSLQAINSSSLAMILPPGGTSGAGGFTDLVACSKPGDISRAAAEEAATLLHRPYNQRIELPAADEVSDGEGGTSAGGAGAGVGVMGASVEDDGIHDLDGDELTREKVKKAASQVTTALSDRPKFSRGLQICRRGTRLQHSQLSVISMKSSTIDGLNGVLKTLMPDAVCRLCELFGHGC